MKKIIKKLLLKPPYVKWCSQTIYQSLLGTVKIFELTGEKVWEDRSRELYEILSKIQQPDGGFDIGYNFDFGLLHRKGESTSPEMVGLLAMLEYGRVFGFNDNLICNIEKAIGWIEKYSIKIDNDYVFIPYAPYSTAKVMVYNGTSFVCGALGYYLGLLNKKNTRLENLYYGMIKYLDQKLIKNQNYAGRCWFYYDQERTDIIKEKKNKIDYYHQMQQVEMHCYSQFVAPHKAQLSIIRDASLYVIDVFEKEKIVPYTNNSNDFGGNIHLWGFSSILPAVIQAKKILTEELKGSEELCKFTLDFILDKGWNGKSFYAEVNRDGIGVEADYMVRSDSWVFNSLATYLCFSKNDYRKEEIIEVLDICYNTMANVNFSGLESHASTLKTRVVGKTFTFFKQIFQN